MQETGQKGGSPQNSEEAYLPPEKQAPTKMAEMSITSPLRGGGTPPPRAREAGPSQGGDPTSVAQAPPRVRPPQGQETPSQSPMDPPSAFPDDRPPLPLPNGGGGDRV